MGIVSKRSNPKRLQDIRKLHRDDYPLRVKDSDGLEHIIFMDENSQQPLIAYFIDNAEFYVLDDSDDESFQFEVLEKDVGVTIAL